METLRYAQSPAKSSAAWHLKTSLLYIWGPMAPFYSNKRKGENNEFNIN